MQFTFKLVKFSASFIMYKENGAAIISKSWSILLSNLFLKSNSSIALKPKAAKLKITSYMINKIF